MKRIILTLSAIFFSAVCFSQGYPKGVYMSLDEIVTRNPSQQMDFEVSRNSGGDRKIIEGYSYSLTTADKSIKRSYLSKNIWAYSDGESLYFNCFQIKAQPSFVKLIADGKYMVFRGGPIEGSAEMKKQQSQMAMMGGVFGGALGSIAVSMATGGQTGSVDFLYTLDKDNGEVKMIDYKVMEDLLATSHPPLYDAFVQEKDWTSEENQIKYLKLLNEHLQTKD